MLRSRRLLLTLATVSLGRVMGISRLLSKREILGHNQGFLSELRAQTMDLGLLFLESVSTGVITREEMNWVAANQDRFSRIEEATAIRLGRLVDSGLIQLGCRLKMPLVICD